MGIGLDTKKLIESAKEKISKNNIMILDEQMLKQILKRHLRAYLDNFETIDKFKVKKIISTEKDENGKTKTKEEYFFVLSFRFREMA